MIRRKTPSRRRPYQLALATVPFTAIAHAATDTWTNPVSGTFSMASNWTSAVPGATDTARFSAAAASPYTVTFTTSPTNDALLFLQDNVIFDLKARTYSLTNASSTNQSVQIGSSAGGTLLVKSSTGTGTLSSQYTVIGRASGGTGSLTIDAGTLWKCAGDCVVGNTGTGTLTVQSGADLSASSLILGNAIGSTGNATFTGAGTAVTTSANTILGAFGRGSLSLQLGAHLNTSALILGNLGGATGSLAIDGAGTAVTSSGDLTVGWDGKGSLTLSNSASLSNANAFVAVSAGTTSSATLSGASSSWTSSGSFYVGGDDTTAGGQATVNMQAGSLSVAGALKIWNSTSTSFNFSGGSLTAGSLDTGPSRFSWTGGSLTLTNSSLTLNSSGPLGSSLTLNPGMSLNVTGSGKTLTLPSGSSLTINGGTLNAATTYSSGSSVNLAAGSLTVPAITVSSTLTNNGSVVGPATGTATFAAAVSGSGSYTGNVLFKSSFSPGSSTTAAPVSLAAPSFASTNTLNMKLGGATPGSQHDQLTFTNAAALGGTLNISLLNSFSPAAGQTFDLFNGTTTGTFATVTLPAISPLRWNTNLLYTDGTLRVRPASESLTWASAVSGTYSDYAKWSTGLAAPGTPDTAVFNNASASPYTVTLPNAVTSDRLQVLNDNVKFILGSTCLFSNPSPATPGISIGSAAGASLSFSGFINSSLGAYNIVVAPNSGDTGNLTVYQSGYPGVALLARSLYLGGSATAPGGAGTLNIPSGSVSVDDALKIWNTPNTSLNLTGGTLNVGSLDLSSNPARFNWTAGTLNFTKSDLVLDPTGFFGSSLSLPSGKTLQASSYATLTIDAGSTLSLIGGGVSVQTVCYLGSSPGSASLSVTAGEFSSSQIHIGYNAGSTGVATITGAASHWSSSNTTIGYDGAGSVNLSAVPYTDFGNCFLGLNSTGVGTLVIDGPSTVSAGMLVVAEYGNASLTVQNGASLMAGTIIADHPGSTGTATLTGSSSWQSIFAYVGGNASSPGGKGVLNIQSGSFTTTGDFKIWNTPGSPVNLSGGSLTVGSLDTDSTPENFNWTAGTLDITNSDLVLDYPNSYCPLGPSLTLPAGKTLRISSSNFSFANNNGTLNLTGGTLFGRNIDLRHGTTNFSSGTLQIDSGILYTGYTPTSQTFAGAITGTGSLNKDSTTTLNLTGPLSYTGSTQINQGTLALSTPLTSTSSIGLNAGATLRLLPGSSIDTRNLYFATSPATATIDLTTTSLTFGPSPTSFAALRALLAASYDHGHWDLPGINSSSAAANPLTYSVGYGEDDQANSFVVRFTFVGDINLDGKLDADDYAALDRSFARHLSATWTTGDFNYDGAVNAADYLLIDTAYARTHTLAPGPLAQREAEFGSDYVSALVASVPEPSLIRSPSHH